MTATDAETMHQTCALSFIDVKGKPKLHALWVSALGKTEWREVPTFNPATQTFGECQVFNEDE